MKSLFLRQLKKALYTKKPNPVPSSIRLAGQLLTPKYSLFSEASARKLLAAASVFAVLCNPDISIKNLIKANLMHRDHINRPQLPIVLSQYQRGMDLKKLWTTASPRITLVVSLIEYYFLQSAMLCNTTAYLSLTALFPHAIIPGNVFCPVFKSTKTL